MSPTIGIDPMTLTLADLDVMEAPTTAIVKPAPAAVKPLTKRDTRQRIIGAMKMINWLCGGEMQQEIDSTDFLVRRIDELEAQMEKMREQFEQEKSHYRKANENEIAGYKKALRNIAARLEVYRDPFNLLPFSKWKNEAKGKWMLAAGETIDWAVQRADNQLDPINAVVIAADED